MYHDHGADAWDGEKSDDLRQRRLWIPKIRRSGSVYRVHGTERAGLLRFHLRSTRVAIVSTVVQSAHVYGGVFALVKECVVEVTCGREGAFCVTSSMALT